MIAKLLFLPLAIVAAPAQDWRYYGGDAGSTKYTPISQIDASNFARLQIAWRWRSIDLPIQEERAIRTWLFESTPLSVNGILYNEHLA